MHTKTVDDRLNSIIDRLSPDWSVKPETLLSLAREAEALSSELADPVDRIWLAGRAGQIAAGDYREPWIYADVLRAACAGISARLNNPARAPAASPAGVRE